jgi:uncharacterized protein YbjT (DUF2867 family)
MSKSLVVIGATGTQGTALLTALYASSTNDTIYAIHRKPASASVLLAKYPSINPIRGDLNSAAAIFRTIRSAPDVVFFLTPSDSKNEVELGRNIISAAVQAGTKHIVMSSIDRGLGGNVLSGVDIWDTKHEIEAFLRQQKNITYTIIRPSAYLENFSPGFIAQVYSSVWRDCVDGRKMSLVSTKDIGIFAAKTMLAPDEYRNVEINLAGDNLSFDEANRIFSMVTGGRKIPTVNKHLTTVLVAMMKELKQMTVFYKERDTGAEVSRDLISWDSYIRQSGYITGNKS